MRLYSEDDVRRMLPMKAAIDEASELAQDVKVLGSYPVAVL